MSNDNDRHSGSGELLRHISAGVGTLTINRPQVRNAITPEYLLQVIEAIGDMERDSEVRVIVLTGQGKAFCAGADMSFLDALTRMSAEQIGEQVYAAFQGVARAIKHCGKPVVAAVNGPAIGAGCELAVACDFRIASSTAVFCENWIDLGIMPPLGGLYLLPRLIGLERATDMVMRATRVDAQRALQIGLVTEVAEPEQFEAAVAAFAASLAARPARALKIIKQALRRGMDGSLAGEWEFNVQAQSLLLGGPDFAAAIAAIRAPKT